MIQGFRSADPRAGSLDAEFQAFENAPLNPFQFQQQPNRPGAFATPPPQSSGTGWATDFQNLRLADSPVPVQQFRAEAPLIRAGNGGWQNEFIQQRSGSQTPVSKGKQAVREQTAEFSNNVAFPRAYNRPMFQSQGYNFQNPSFQSRSDLSQNQEARSANPELDAQFEQAFSDAFAHVEQMDRMESRNILHQDGTYTNDHSQESHEIQEPAVQIPTNDVRIGSDAIEYTEREARTEDQNVRDASELARTAGQLLNSVQHDTSDKFQNSQFLNLMRKIRDREIEVQNNDFQSTVAQSEMITDLHSNVTGQNGLNIGQSGLTAQQARMNIDQPGMMFQQPGMNMSHHNMMSPGFQVNNPQENTHPAEQSQERNSDSFDFPDMDEVYMGGDWWTVPDHMVEGHIQSQMQMQQMQAQELHPGGRYYPEQSPRLNLVEPTANITAAEFDKHDENAFLASRYRKPSVSDDVSGHSV